MTSYNIESVAFGGDGVARSDGLVIFIPFTLPKETVTASIYHKKKNFAKALPKEIVEKSPYRIPPPCPSFSTCGGCQLQHASYPHQLELKKRFVEDSLTRIGKISFPVPDVTPSSSPFFYRRHISLKIQKLNENWKLCFASTKGDPLPIYSCLLFHTQNDPILDELQNTISRLDPAASFTGKLKLIKTTDGYIAAFSFEKKLPEKDEKNLRSIFSSTSLKGIYIETSDKKSITEQCPLNFTCNGLTFNYSPFSFIQNHKEQSEKIYDLILSLMKDCKKVLDIYCGIGVSSLLLAKQEKEVIGIEINPYAIEMAKENAKQNNLPSARFFCSAAEDSSEELIKEFTPDSALVNPPRTGLDIAVRQSLCFSSIRYIVYVSCHPPTLARDLAFLQAEGFVLKKLQSFDMFPQTTHVETVVSLSR